MQEWLDSIDWSTAWLIAFRAWVIILLIAINSSIRQLCSDIKNIKKDKTGTESGGYLGKN